MNQSKVWVVKEQGTMDFSPAEQYGQLQFITRADIPLYENSTSREIWEADVAKFVAAYNPLTDFIIPTGQPAAIMAIGHALGVAGKTPRFLVWRREDNHYRILGLNPVGVPA